MKFSMGYRAFKGKLSLSPTSWTFSFVSMTTMGTIVSNRVRTCNEMTYLPVFLVEQSMHALIKYFDKVCLCYFQHFSGTPFP
jgi:hypothetical protein